MKLIFLHSQLSIEGILLVIFVLGLFGGIITSLLYSFLLMFYPDKNVKAKDIIIIMGTVMVFAFGYFILFYF